MCGVVNVSRFVDLSLFHKTPKTSLYRPAGLCKDVFILYETEPSRDYTLRLHTRAHWRSAWPNCHWRLMLKLKITFLKFNLKLKFFFLKSVYKGYTGGHSPGLPSICCDCIHLAVFRKFAWTPSSPPSPGVLFYQTIMKYAKYSKIEICISALKILSPGLPQILVTALTWRLRWYIQWKAFETFAPTYSCVLRKINKIHRKIKKSWRLWKCDKNTWRRRRCRAFHKLNCEFQLYSRKLTGKTTDGRHPSTSRCH